MKGLLSERKSHTDRSVSSTSSAILSPGGDTLSLPGGYPIPGWGYLLARVGILRGEQIENITFPHPSDAVGKNNMGRFFLLKLPHLKPCYTRVNHKDVGLSGNDSTPQQKDVFFILYFRVGCSGHDGRFKWWVVIIFINFILDSTWFK